MKTKKYNQFINEIPNLNTLQFRKLREAVDKRVKSKKISNILETPENDLICPHCKGDNYYRWGKRNDLQRYKCKICKKTFNSLTRTPLARLRRKGHWLDYSECLKNGLTVREAAKVCEIHKNTSFRWRHRFMTNSNKIKAKKLAGIIETQNIIFKESFKGSKKIPARALLSRKDIHIINSLDRNNNLFDITNKSFSIRTLNKYLKNIISENSLMCTNSETIYNEFNSQNNIKHKITEKSHKSYYNSNNVNVYSEEFIKWIQNHFRGVATKYLENYVSWFRGLKEFKNIQPITLLYRAKSVEKYRFQPLKVTNLLL